MANCENLNFYLALVQKVCYKENRSWRAWEA